MSVWNFTIYKSSRQAFFSSWILEERSQDDWAKQTIRRKRRKNHRNWDWASSTIQRASVSSERSVRRNPIKCLWFNSLSLFSVLILLLPLRLFLPPEVLVFQYRLSLPILEIVPWTPSGGTNRQVKRLLLRGYGEIPIKINPIGEQDAKRQYC